MRLINTSTIAFQEFYASEDLVYAIVSHRWGSNEVSYQDFLDGHAGNRRGPGWQKTLKCCDIALSRGIRYLWIDTACFDKRASAEVTESINSMFRWYANATECYAILPDVYQVASDPGFAEELRKSVWFERGWTLQELLAPQDVEFFNARYISCGFKRHGLTDDISRATGINSEYLLNTSLIHRASVAERMRWASKRETTRIEDEAYCLLGLFDVNMCMIYGEGRKAFVRLQKEIISKTDDESIFAWWTDSRWTGLLAPWPAAFSGHLPIETRTFRPRAPYGMTNKGLRLTVCVPATHTDREAVHLLPLNCQMVSQTEKGERRCQQIAIGVMVSPIDCDAEVPLEGAKLLPRSRTLSLDGANVATSARHTRLVLSHYNAENNTELGHWDYNRNYSSYESVLTALSSARLDFSRVIYFKQDGL